MDPAKYMDPDPQNCAHLHDLVHLHILKRRIDGHLHF